MPFGESFEVVLGAARQGEEWAFSALYRQLNPRLIRYFSARVPQEADDLAAETWVGAARSLGSFEGDERAFTAWMFTIAHRRLVQHWRDEGRRPVADQGGEQPEAATTVDVEGDVLEMVGAREAARAIAAALTPEQAEVVLLRILGGLDVDEVAAILGKRPGAVRALQHKALRRLATTSFSIEVLTR